MGSARRGSNPLGVVFVVRRKYRNAVLAFRSCRHLEERDRGSLTVFRRSVAQGHLTMKAVNAPDAKSSTLSFDVSARAARGSANSGRARVHNTSAAGRRYPTELGRTERKGGCQFSRRGLAECMGKFVFRGGAPVQNTMHPADVACTRSAADSLQSECADAQCHGSVGGDGSLAIRSCVQLGLLPVVWKHLTRSEMNSMIGILSSSSSG